MEASGKKARAELISHGYVHRRSVNLAWLLYNGRKIMKAGTAAYFAAPAADPMFVMFQTATKYPGKKCCDLLQM